MVETIVIPIALLIAYFVARQGGYAPTPNTPITPTPKEDE